jgi:hypothetical protein
MSMTLEAFLAQPTPRKGWESFVVSRRKSERTRLLVLTVLFVIASGALFHWTVSGMDDLRGFAFLWSMLLVVWLILLAYTFQNYWDFRQLLRKGTVVDAKVVDAGNAAAIGLALGAMAAPIMILENNALGAASSLLPGAPMPYLKVSFEKKSGSTKTVAFLIHATLEEATQLVGSTLPVTYRPWPFNTVGLAFRGRLFTQRLY